MEQPAAQPLSQLFHRWSGSDPESIVPLPLSGSNRRYFRLRAGSRSAIGVYNPDEKENKAFVGFTKHFRRQGLPVPELFDTDLERHVYLQEDLGDETLLNFLFSCRTGEAVPEPVLDLYKQVVRDLPRIQVLGGRGLDYSLCYPRQAFDHQSMRWDLSYFKYYFLKLAYVPFDEQLLEEDFEALANYLCRADTSHFLFRDFQARNIMLKDGRPYYIDYQGGRKGALQYDLASLLYQAKADLPDAVREMLLREYMDAAGELIDLDAQSFREFYYGYVMIRCIQVLGAYGFRGFFERKAHFLESIPFALKNIAWLMDNVELPVRLPELFPVLRAMLESEKLQALNKARTTESRLTVTIRSFSYKRGLPDDTSGNGGGFIFDCRALHNPGRYEPYKALTGLDQPVIDFLNANSRIEAFLQDVYAVVEPSVERYIERDFTSLMVSFGCTGGQHRSVYSAEQLKKHLEKKYPVKVDLEHRERPHWP